jgi:ribosome biogenesis SPOUT family RNA methylase Rps3
VVEHLEEEVSRWTLCEYTHMLLVLNGLYADSKQAPSKLILTNFRYKAEHTQGTLEEDEYYTKRHVETLLKINANLGGRGLFSRHDLRALTTREKLDEIVASGDSSDDSVEIAELFRDKMLVAPNSTESNICFMDMRGEKVLGPEDAGRFSFVIFGGILGDHPPQDRGKQLRENFANVRQLGTVQMTTDTALMVSREILEEQRPIASLAFVTDPSIPSDEHVTRYLDGVLSLATLAEGGFQQVTTLRSAAQAEIPAFERYC